MDEPQPKRSFLEELKRRKVARVAIAYAGVAFVGLQGAQIVLDSLGMTAAFRILVLVTLAGFPIALVLSWLFEVTPEGLRLTSRRGGEGRLLARLRPWVAYGLGSALVVIAVAVVLLNFPRSAAGEVASGADVIAVLPFETRGEGVEVLGEGMVELLSRNLDQVGAIRTIDFRTVLYRWQQRFAERTTVPLAELLELGNELRARSVLTGAVMAVGDEVAITADLYRLDGSPLAPSVRVTGSKQSLLPLVDTLAVVLLREIWRSSSPLPNLEVSEITSGNIVAIRAFLEGEKHYRGSRWNQALSKFAEAVAVDPFFWLAHYRLAATAGWLGARERGLGRMSASLAMSRADSLPEREGMLVRAQALTLEGASVEARDTLRAYVRRYPDDPEGWFALADNEYHLQDEHVWPNPRPAPERLRHFDRALDLDPTFGPASIHPLEVAFEIGDTALIRKYLHYVEANPSADSLGTRVYTLAAEAIASGDAARIALALDSAAHAHGAVVVDAGRQAALAVLQPLIRVAALLPAAGRATVLDRIRTAAEGGPEEAAPLARLLAAGGRVRESRALIARHAGAFGGEHLVPIAVAPLTAGYDTATPVDSLPIDVGFVAPRWVELFAAIDAGDAAAVRRVAARPIPISLAAEADSLGTAAFTRAALAYAAVLERGPAAFASVERALADLSFAHPSVQALWFRLLDRMAEHEASRARALSMLAQTWPGDPLFEVLRHELLGRLYTAQGDTAQARAAYTTFLQATDGADAGLALQPRIERVRAALARTGS